MNSNKIVIGILVGILLLGFSLAGYSVWKSHKVELEKEGDRIVKEKEKEVRPKEEKEQGQVEKVKEVKQDSDLFPDPISTLYVFFMHHSTGEIYWNGGLEKALKDHSYKGYAPWWDGGTDPPDFYGEFSDSNKWAIIARENMPEGRERNIILFKSCFPASNIDSSSALENYKNWYRQLFEIYTLYPEKLFVPMSTPPLLKVNTSPEAAQRSLQFEEWLITDYVSEYQDYLSKQGLSLNQNLAPFPLHSLLSDKDGYLLHDFWQDEYDDHPSLRSGKVVGEAMWKHLNKAIQKMNFN